jgi:hypothetical protein
MFQVILIVFPALLATWVSYWSTNLFKPLSNRPSRISCLVSPGVLAVTIGLALCIYLGAAGTDIELPDLEVKYVAPALLMGLTTLLIIPTLLIALLVSKLSRHAGPRKRDAAR